MKTTVYLFVFGLILNSFYAIAGNGYISPAATQLLHPKNWAFEENRGQLADQSGNLLREIKYFGNYAGVQVYCSLNHLSFVFLKTIPDNNIVSDNKLPLIKTPAKTKSSIVASRID